MTKKPNYGLQKFTAGCLALVALLFFVSVGCSMSQMPRGEKHTGQVTVRWCNGMAFEFKRPNGEIFEMAFDPSYLGPQIKVDDVLSDLVYTDQKDHRAFFVKAMLLSEAAAPEPSDMMLYSGQSYVCWGSGPCNVSPVKAYYRWKDGGYRDKPEPAKAKH